MYRTAYAIAATLLIAGCAGNGDGLDENGRPIGSESLPLAPTFDSIQQNVFTPICSRCHAGAGAPFGLRLDAASSYAMLVNAPSVEQPTLRRILPGNPDLSYLVQKIEGHAATGGQMPLGGPPLSADTIAAIRQWVMEGAPQTSASADPQGPAVLAAITPDADAILEKAPAQIVVSATVQLDTTSINAGTVSLVRSGGDGSFDEGNEITVPALSFEIRSVNPTVLAIAVPASAWVPDSYRLRIAGAGTVVVADLAGIAIDGDRDGHAGGDFVTDFDLGRPL
jgi:mono/diheme cytochrome c family protein